MQVEIRSADKTSFSNIGRFLDYKANGDLSDPSATASQVLQFIQQPELAKDVLCSVRDL